MNRIIGAALFFAVSVYSASQEMSSGSAKALFAPVPFPKATETPGQPAISPHPSNGHVKQPSSTSQGPAHRPVQLAPGLKYWVELVQPGSAQILRVNATRIFHSGERIRLHVESNVEGRILLFQLNPNGTSQVLFPDRRVNHGDSHIQAGTDTAIPAGNAWFTFDDHPAVERLMVFLEPDPDPAAEVQIADTKPAPHQQNNFPDALQASPGSRIDADKTATLVSVLNRRRGDKSLVLEVDNTSDAPAGYAVDSGATRGRRETLAIEIPLKHQ